MQALGAAADGDQLKGWAVTLKVPDASEAILLGYIRAGLGATCVLRLFVNDHVPADADDETDYTEASFPGYAPVTLTSWGLVTTAAGTAQIAHPAASWTRSAGGGAGDQVYGYYVTDAAGDLLWSERDPAAPVPMNVAGYSYSVLARLTLHTEF